MLQDLLSPSLTKALNATNFSVSTALAASLKLEYLNICIHFEILPNSPNYFEAIIFFLFFFYSLII